MKRAAGNLSFIMLTFSRSESDPPPGVLVPECSILTRQPGSVVEIRQDCIAEFVNGFRFALKHVTVATTNIENYL
jgi:hypothetical protein